MKIKKINLLQIVIIPKSALKNDLKNIKGGNGNNSGPVKNYGQEIQA